MRRLVISSVERADEVPGRIAGYAREGGVVEIEMAVAGQMLAHALQAQEYVTPLRPGAAGTARDHLVETRLHAVDFIEYGFPRPAVAAAYGAYQFESASHACVVYLVQGREQTGIGYPPRTQSAAPDGRRAEQGKPQRMAAAGSGQLFGQFLLDREGVVRWTFTEVPEGGQRMFGMPSPQELMSAASQVAG